MTDADSIADQPDAPKTILDRLLTSGMGEERARGWLEASAVEVAGERVSDPATPCPWGVSYAINPQ